MAPEIRIIYDTDTLIESVRTSLDQLGYEQLGRIRCQVRDTTVHLSGSLSSYYLKQIAQTVAIRVPGVHQVINEIEVNPSARAKSPPRNG